MKLLDSLKKIQADRHFLIIQMRKDEELHLSWATDPKGDLLQGRLTQESPSCLVIDIGKIADEISSNPKTEYVNSDIKAETGLTLRQIQYYTTENIILPKLKGSGRGSFHKYSPDNLLDFFIIRELWKYGITLQKIKDIFSKLELAAKSFDYAYRRLNK